MRKITVYQTANQSKREYTTAATTWSQIRAEMGDFYRTGLKAIVMQTRATLEHDDAVLPTGDFTIMLTPMAVKSGAELDMASVLGSLRQKFNDAMDEVIEEIEDGEHIREGGSSDSDDLKRQAAEIMKGF